MKSMRQRRAVSGSGFRVSGKESGALEEAASALPLTSPAPRPATTLEYDREIGCYRWTVKGKA